MAAASVDNGSWLVVAAALLVCLAIYLNRRF